LSNNFWSWVNSSSSHKWITCFRGRDNSVIECRHCKISVLCTTIKYKKRIEVRKLPWTLYNNNIMKTYRYSRFANNILTIINQIPCSLTITSELLIINIDNSFDPEKNNVSSSLLLLLSFLVPLLSDRIPFTQMYVWNNTLHRIRYILQT